MQGFVGLDGGPAEIVDEPAVDLRSTVAQQQEEIAALKALLRKERAENQVLRARIFEFEMEQV